MTATLLAVALLSSAAGAGDPPAPPGAMAPRLTPDGDGALLTWLEPGGDGEAEGADRYRLRFARFAGGAWDRPRTIVESDAVFANWADVPAVIRTDDAGLVAHWLRRSGDVPYAYDVMLLRSTDAGETWEELGPAHDDGTETEHGFVSLVPETGGARAFWLDGRAMAGGGDMAARTALIRTSVGESAVLDKRVCECCATAAVATAAGPLVFYRDRGPREVRDIAVVRRVEGRWTAPRRVHEDGWRIAACPVNGPAADADGDRVAVAWFTGAADGGAVRAAFSTDAGAEFGPPVTVDGSRPLGRVALRLEPGGDAVVCWLDADGGGALRLCRVSPDGAAAAVTVAPATVSRAGGFPRLAIVDGSALVVWTEAGDTTRLRAALLKIAAIPR